MFILNRSAGYETRICPSGPPPILKVLKAQNYMNVFVFLFCFLSIVSELFFFSLFSWVNDSNQVFVSPTEAISHLLFFLAPLQTCRRWTKAPTWTWTGGDYCKAVFRRFNGIYWRYRAFWLVICTRQLQWRPDEKQKSNLGEAAMPW